MTKIKNDVLSKGDSGHYPERLSDTVVHELEFSIAIGSEGGTTTTEAPMLEALTTYRKEQLN